MCKLLTYLFAPRDDVTGKKIDIDSEAAIEINIPGEFAVPSSIPGYVEVNIPIHLIVRPNFAGLWDKAGNMVSKFAHTIMLEDEEYARLMVATACKIQSIQREENRSLTILPATLTVSQYTYNRIFGAFVAELHHLQDEKNQPRLQWPLEA